VRPIPAGELQVGDVFYREVYRPPDPARDMRYTVRSLRRARLMGYYGEHHERVHVEAIGHVTGRRVLDLGVDERVWLADG